jgi:hypothetical protein
MLSGQPAKSKEMKRLLLQRLDYNENGDFILSHYEHPTDYVFFPFVMPSWDNTASRGKDSFLFYNSSPSKFGEWVAFNWKQFIPRSDEENFLFINAWNEWAEGNHMEPCQRYGRGYLEALSNSF